MTKTARISLKVAVVIQEQDGEFFARCPFLNVLTHASSPDQAFQNLEAEIRFLFDAALQDGTFAAMLDYRTSQSRAASAPDDHAHTEIRTTEIDLPENIPAYLVKRLVDAPELSA